MLRNQAVRWDAHVLARAAVLVALCFSSVACSNDEPAKVDDAAVLRVEPATSTIVEGDEVALRAELVDPRGKHTPAPGVTWTSEAPAVASVDAGVVHALTVGTTKIIATSGALRATSSVTVQ